MTTTEMQTKNYERLNGYIEKIVNSFQTAGRIIEEYMNAAKEEGITENEAKAYLKEKIPKSTFYKYLPLEYKDPRKQTRVTHNVGVSGPPVDQKSPEFDTKGMGVVIPESESSSESATGADGQEVEQEVQITSIPVESNDEHDRLVARIQELEKEVSVVSFQKASDTSPTVPPAQQIIIVPHQMILEIDKKRMSVGLNGIYKLQTENNIVTGIEVVNVQ